MKAISIKHKNLNGGEKTEIFYPTRDEEINAQVAEILDNEEYGFVKKPNGVYVDLGANVGMATLYFRNFAKQIYSIEPNPDLYACLVRNVGEYENVKTINVGVANRAGSGFMYASMPDDIAQTVYPPRSGTNFGMKQVQFTTIDALFDGYNIDHVDLLKVDIEDSEYLVFPDKHFASVADRIDAIVGEAHITPDKGFPEIIPVILERYGFKTTYPELKRPNFRRRFIYTDIDTGDETEYYVSYNTIFVATKP